MRNQQLVKQKEKQERIDQLIGVYLDRSQSDWAGRPGQRRIALVTRSAASPVAQALAANFDDLEQAGVAIRVIFSNIDAGDHLTTWYDGTHRAAGGTPLVNAVRWAANPALVDAHEQLVLGHCLSWYGDSMRRDPATRDALETFNTFCEPSAVQAMRSFENIWRCARPVANRQPAKKPKNLFDANEALAGVFRDEAGGRRGIELPKRH
ncbi:MAG: hypothetical protein AAGJ70_09785 [Pseudomonadota bacterium]